MPTEEHTYRFEEDFARAFQMPEAARTGKFVGKAVLCDATKPKKLWVLALLGNVPVPVELRVFIPQQEDAPDAMYFPYYTDEIKGELTVTTDLRISDSDGKLLFLSPRIWTVPFHRSVYEPYVEFETINKAIFRPKDE